MARATFPELDPAAAAQLAREHGGTVHADGVDLIVDAAVRIPWADDWIAVAIGYRVDDGPAEYTLVAHVDARDGDAVIDDIGTHEQGDPPEDVSAAAHSVAAAIALVRDREVEEIVAAFDAAVRERLS